MCELHGGYLAHIETKEEQSFMRQLLQGLHGKFQVLTWEPEN
jgi:hypothetical protein